jgi:hypothetical protein
VPLVNLFDIAVLDARGSIGRSIKKLARSEWLNYEMNFCSESTSEGDCPILLPLSLDPRNSSMYPCCSKLICNGCNHANQMRELEGKLEKNVHSVGIQHQKWRTNSRRVE